nr:hypothetical protein [Tanacetum cinerariifolium]
MPNPPIDLEEYAMNDDDTKVIYDEDLVLRQQSTAQVIPPSLVNTPPSHRLDVLGDENLDIHLPFGKHLVNLLMEDKEIDLHRKMVRQLLSILLNNPVLTPRMSDEPLGNSDSMSKSVETGDFLLEELATEIGLNDSIPIEIDDGYYDSEGDILYLE